MINKHIYLFTFLTLVFSSCENEEPRPTADQPPYPTGSVFGPSGPTIVNGVTNPSTGKIWMDRNLGAIQVATSSTDENSYGDLYQWGRGADGHQLRTSTTTSILSSTDQPPNNNYILTQNPPQGWRSPQNIELWQDRNGVNNPCPSGYRLPTDAELNEERLSWSRNNAGGAFSSPLKLPMAGFRGYTAGILGSEGIVGHYWSCSFGNINSRSLSFGNSTASIVTSFRALGRSIFVALRIDTLIS